MVEAPEQIAPGVYRVDGVGLANAISVLVVRNDDGWALVDTGVRSTSLRIQEALAALGAEPGELKRIYLTHHHADHIGGLQAVRWWATEAEVVAPEHEAQIISGERSPDPSSNTLFRFFARRQRLPSTPVDRIAMRAIALPAFVL